MELPVVIVGKDRTRMTCAVIDHVREHVKNAGIKFICVSDRSRDGHDAFVENHLKSIGAEGYEVLRTKPEESRYGWGAAINIGLRKAFEGGAPFALLLDNDWLLERDLDVKEYLYVFNNYDIGAITFKPVNGGTNINLREVGLDNGSVYLKREPKTGTGRISFTAEIGCAMISRWMYEAAGDFKENCVTDETEWKFCNWYNGLTDKERTEKCLWYVTDKSLFHTELNGEGHVFTHVGINSQHPGPQQWWCPEEYRYLSDDEEDERVCAAQGSANSIPSQRDAQKCALVAIAKDEDDYIDEWISYNLKVGFSDIFIYQNDWRYKGSLYQRHPKVHWEIADGEQQQCLVYNKFIKENYLKYSYAAFFDIDEFIHFNEGCDLQSFMDEFKTEPAICVRWRLFGDNGKSYVEGGDVSVLRRFTKCAKKLSESVKQIINFTVAKDNLLFGIPHILVTKDKEEFHSITPNKKHVCEKGRESSDCAQDKVELYHYRNKTWSECCSHRWMKRNPCEAEIPCIHKDKDAFRRLFDEWNFNEVENTNARDFLYGSRECLPCVIIGHERTEATKKVIASIIANVQNVDLYFIISSDRSSPGHIASIRDYLSSNELKGTVVETKEGHTGLGSAMNNGVELAFSKSDVVLEIENDVCFTKPIDAKWVVDCIRESKCGAFSLKPLGASTNVVRHLSTFKGVDFEIADCADKTHPCYANCIGARFVSIRHYKAFGPYVENEKPEKVEMSTCWLYCQKDFHEKENLRVLVGFNPDFFMDLQGEGEHGLLHLNETTQKNYSPTGYLMPTNNKPAQTSQSKIEWSKYFDAIYCFHYIPQTEREPRLLEELKRIGILDSGIFQMKYTFPTRYNKVLLESVCSDCRWKDNEWVASLSLAQMAAFSEALHLGFKKVLVLEDDIAFLKDVNAIKEFLDNISPNYDYIQLDKFSNPQNHSDFAERNPINGYYYEPNDFCTAADCLVLTDKAMRKFIEVQEKQITPSDIAIRFMGVPYAVSRKNLCIQLLYKGCCNLKLGPIAYQDECYKGQKIDYNDYAVPEGYDYGITVENVSKCKSSNIIKKGRKFVSVYAIAKNEADVARRWYECVKEADEVCVLDTGSTDGTVEILRGLGAKVSVKTYDEWSFAVARNDSMGLVSPDADILFTLDLDETIAPGWRKRLEDAWCAEEAKGEKPAGCVYKYIWSWRQDGKEAQSFSIRKIHAKGTGEWKYRCHELLTSVDGHIFFLDGFVVEHHQNKKTIRSQYLPLLEKDAKEMPNDDRSAYYYARELMYNEEWEKAKDEFLRHLSLSSATWRAERASSMRNIARCYEHMKDDDRQELWLLKSADEDPSNRDATYRLGLLYMKRKDYLSSIKAFEKCLAIEKPSLEYISDPMSWSAHPWFLYSQALWWAGRWNDAVNASKKALEIAPTNGDVRAQLAGMSATKEHFPNHR